MFVYLNDKVVPASEAKVSIFDHGYLYGDGIYETLRVYDGVVFMFDEHLERLCRSASLIGLSMPKDTAEIKSAVYETLQANRLANAYVRIMATRGEGPIGLDPALCKEPAFIVVTNEFKNYPRTYYENGVTLTIATIRRNCKEALNPQIKSLNFLNNILAKIEAKRADVYEAIMLNHGGYLAEGTICNIFFVKDGVLCTPSVACGILDGITRRIVVDLARESGLEVNEGMFRPEELLSASEIFITNTTMEVMPVRRVGATEYRVGEVSKMLLTEYAKEVRGYIFEKKGESPSLWQ